MYLSEKNMNKSQFYCKHCMRYVLSMICPIHGTVHVIKIEKEAAQSPSLPKEAISAPTQNGGFKSLPFPNDEQDTMVIQKPARQAAVASPAPLPKTVENQSSSLNGFFTEADFSFPIEPDDTDISLSWKRPGHQKPKPQAPITQDIQQNKIQLNPPQVKKAEPDQPDNLGFMIEHKLKTLSANRKNILPKEKKPNNGVVFHNGNELAAFKPTIIRANSQTKVSDNLPRKAAKKITPIKKQKFSFKDIFVAIFAILILTAGGLAFVTYYPDYLRDSLYSKAENFYNQGMFAAALVSYQEFRQKYPDDQIHPEITDRIALIEQLNIETKKQEKIINALLIKAENAFNNRRYTTPARNNAIYYTSKIIRYDQNFAPAIELQNRIVNYYIDQAETAFNQQKLDRAIFCYKTILKIKPADKDIINELDHILKVKNINKTLSNLSELATTKEELKKLQKAKYKLKTQVKQEKRTLNKISELKKNSSTNLLKKPEGRKERPIGKDPKNLKTNERPTSSSSSLFTKF